jgi:hypothetical protein
MAASRVFHTPQWMDFHGATVLELPWYLVLSRKAQGSAPWRPACTNSVAGVSSPLLQEERWKKHLEPNRPGGSCWAVRVAAVHVVLKHCISI